MEFSEFKKNHSPGLSGIIPVSKHDCAEMNSYISLRRTFGRMIKYKHSVSFADSSSVLLLSHFLRPEILKRPAGNT